MLSGDDERRDGGDNRDAWASERVYRALIRLYPQEVRRRYAEEMVLYFGDLCKEAWRSGGPMALALLWARTLPDLIFSALKERGAVLPSNAYLPLGPRIVARWGALCALMGGFLGVAYHLSGYFLRALDALTGGFSGDDRFTMFFTNSLWLGALSLSSLGLLGLYGAVVVRSGRPGLLAGAGAVFSTVSAVLWLATTGYAAIGLLASGSALFAPFEWVRNTGTFVIPVAILLWFVGFVLLGLATARQPLPARLRVLPLAPFALVMPSYLLGGYLGTLYQPSVTATIVMGLAQSLPFVGMALLGWVLLKAYDAAGEPLAVSGGSAESVGAAREMARSVSRTTIVAWGAARSATSAGKDATKERELLEAIRRYGEITAAQAALETSLSVEEVDRMLSALAARGHLEVRVDGARIVYSLWEGDG